MSFTGLQTDSSLILTNVEVNKDEEIINKLCSLAMKQGYINDLFIEKILEREKVFPTGLSTEVPIAIPHIHDGCLKSFFSMATLNKPVEFAAMDGSEKNVLVEIVFLFGITDPSQQTEVLQKFCEIFQNGDLLRDFKNIKDEKGLLGKLKSVLGNFILL